ncbi:regulation of mast cell degranulation [Branchiostoma belcheri]|nr:regulation of mast cell degranulation [Branchiostoma belcheri]
MREGRYTSKSDVWSFGVVLYEIATLGNVPYPGRERTLLEELRTGYREPRPPGLKQELYDMMLRCWQWEEDDRPEFEELYDELDAVVELMAKDYVKPSSGSPVGGQNEAAEALETSYDVPKSGPMGMQLHVTADVYNSEDRDEVDSLASTKAEASSAPIENDVDTDNDIHTAVEKCKATQQDTLSESEDHDQLQVESSSPPGAVIMDTNDSSTDSELPDPANVQKSETPATSEDISGDAEEEMPPTTEESADIDYAGAHDGHGITDATALYIASFVGHADVVRLLIRKGASLTKRSIGKSNSPLLIAAAKVTLVLLSRLTQWGLSRGFFEM